MLNRTVDVQVQSQDKLYKKVKQQATVSLFKPGTVGDTQLTN